MADLTARLLDPEKFESALAELYLFTTSSQLLVEVARELHARLRTAKTYAAAPVDKGIPMHIYRAVCEQRDHELAERQRMTHRYEVEDLRNKELEELLATAKAEGAAEAYDVEAREWRARADHANSICPGLTISERYLNRAEEAAKRAAAIRNSINSARAGGGK